MASIQHYKPGQIIIKENDVGETAYIIEQGRVGITKEKDGKKLYLGHLSRGDIFGEMSIIDDNPRSATVTAIETTVVKEIHRDRFLDILRTDEDATVKLLKALFNSLRERNIQVLQLQAQLEKAPQQDPVELEEVSEFTALFESLKEETTTSLKVSLEGLTARASQALPAKVYTITQFPYKIGRRSADPLTDNDLAISDGKPFQISRHHLSIINENGRIGVVDRGSTLGAEIDGVRLGGNSHNPGPVFFSEKGGTLVLGSPESPFRYKVTIERKS